MIKIIALLYFSTFLWFKGVPDAGTIALGLLGLFCVIHRNTREKILRDIGGWTAQDTWVSLAIASVFVFKMTSMLWANSPELAMKNALWHSYFMIWPLVFFAFCYLRLRVVQALQAMAVGLIVLGVWNVIALMFGVPLYHMRAGFDLNAGILAELLLVMGTWLFVAVTDKSERFQSLQKWLFGVGSLSAWFVLYTTERRTEWIGFFVIVVVVGIWRIRHWLTLPRALALLGLLLGACVAFFYLREERFLLAYHEALAYWQQAQAGGANNSIVTSVGARMEMYRLGISAFIDHPLIGNSADIRPDRLPQYGGGGLGGEQFHHRHFHSEYLQVLVEGGVVWAAIFMTAVVYFIRAFIVKPFQSSNLISMLAFALMASYMLAGTISASLIYTQAVATFTVFSALLWANLRLKPQQ